MLAGLFGLSGLASANSGGQAPSAEELLTDLSDKVAAQQDKDRAAYERGEELTRAEKVPTRVLRNVKYRIDRISPTRTNKAGQLMGEADFAIDLRYIDTKEFKIKAYSETGEVLILADVTDEPELYQTTEDKKNKVWRWDADCISDDPRYSHPKNTCHVGRWTKEHDDDPSDQDSAVPYGRYWIKLVVIGKEATGITLSVTYETLFDDIDKNMVVNGEPYDPAGSQVVAGQVNTLEMDYAMPDGSAVAHTMYHGAMMHFVILKPDLSKLSHIHPTYNMMKKKFTLKINEARPGDQNNKDLGNALPDPGTYYILTETQPNIEGRQVQPWFSRYQVHAPGDAPPPKPLEVEVPDNYPYFDKYFTKDNKEGREGDFLRVRFSKIYHNSCFRWALQFQLLFSVWNGEEYIPLATDHFGRWLMMPGHAIYLRENLDPDTQNSDWKFRYVAHAHAMSKTAMDGSGLLNYPIHTHGGSIPAGNYKIWFQTKILGEVSTFPFAFEVIIPDESKLDAYPRDDVVQSFCAAPTFDRM